MSRVKISSVSTFLEFLDVRGMMDAIIYALGLIISMKEAGVDVARSIDTVDTDGKMDSM